MLITPWADLDIQEHLQVTVRGTPLGALGDGKLR